MASHVLPPRDLRSEASFRRQPTRNPTVETDAERGAVRCPVIYASRSELFTCLGKLSQRHRAYLDAAVVFIAFVSSFRRVNGIFSAAHGSNNSHVSAVAAARAVASGSTAGKR